MMGGIEVFEINEVSFGRRHEIRGLFTVREEVAREGQMWEQRMRERERKHWSAPSHKVIQDRTGDEQVIV